MPNKPANKPAAKRRRDALAVTEREVNGETKTFWTRIGSAFDNADGSVTVLLDCIPIGGKIQIRDPLPPREPGEEG